MKPEIIEKIKEHYNHAKQKHPYFCDKLSYSDKDSIDSFLCTSRTILKNAIKCGCVSFNDVLICEMNEALKEIIDGNNERAIEELLDMIAVCLRGIDVLEGRQSLGDPAKKSTNNN
jgi:hypothetical protein